MFALPRDDLFGSPDGPEDPNDDPAPSVDDRAHVEELKGELESLFLDANRAMKPRMPRLLENQAFYRGLQWSLPVERDMYPGEFRLDERERPEVENYIRPTVRSAVASKIRGGMPNPQVVTSHKDIRSRQRARCSQRLVRSFMRNGVFSYRTLLVASLAAEIDGLAFLKYFWNPSKGRRREGEIDVQFVDCIDALVDPHARAPEEIRHVFHRKLVPVGRLEDEFPTDIFGQPTKNRWSGSDYLSQIDQRERDSIAKDGNPNGAEGAAFESNQLALVIEYWERPTNTFPKGRLFVWSGDIVIAYDELPYDFPWEPIYGQNILPNSLFADGTVTDLKGPQRSMNTGLAVLREWIEYAGAPGWLNPTNSGVDNTAFENLAGGSIRYNPGAKPEPYAPAAPSAALFDYVSSKVERIKDISTYSDITRGNLSGGDASGRLAAYLKEFEGNVHAPDENLLGIAITNVLQGCLNLARDFYDDGRMLLLVGDRGQAFFDVFRRDDYDFDVLLYVDPFSSKPSSPALRRADVLDLANAQLLGDDPASQRAQKLLEMEDPDASTIDPKEIHHERALDEELAFIENPGASVLEVLPADDDDAHLDEHDIFSISAEYLALPEPLRMRFETHRAQHEQQRSMKLSGYAQQQQTLAGGPAGPPAPDASGGMPSPADGGHSTAMPSAEGQTGPTGEPASPAIPPPPLPGQQPPGGAQPGNLPT